MHPLEQLRDDALREIESARDEQALETARVKYLGRSGTVSAWGEQMKTLAKEKKPVVGKLLNEVRNAVTAAIDSRAQQFRSQKETGALDKIDISLPRTPGAERAGHILSAEWPITPDPHFDGTNPHDAMRAAADSRDRARRGLSS